MKKFSLTLARALFLSTLLLTLIGCEPISVSVNSAGDIAFARAEGVFILNAKSGRIDTVSWNYGGEQLPVLVRWAPDNETLAYSLKAGKDSQDVEIYLIKKSGGSARKIYSESTVITQMEWSPDSKYLSIAQQGDDSDLSVADIVLINAADGTSKLIVDNCGDVHAWLDEKNLALIKINAKNPKNSDIMTGKIATYSVNSGEIQGLQDIKVTKLGSLDTDTKNHRIAFTAMEIGPESQEFIPSQLTKAIYETEILAQLDNDEEKNTVSSAYSLVKGNYRLKGGLDEEARNKLYEALSSAGFIDSSKTYCFIMKSGDSKAEKLSSIMVNFLQFSPNGESLLTKVKNEAGFELGVLNVAAKTYKTVATDIADNVSANAGSVQVYPSWSGNASAVFFRENLVYGSNGLALVLMSVDTATLKMRNLQAGIDADVANLVESRGGY